MADADPTGQSKTIFPASAMFAHVMKSWTDKVMPDLTNLLAVSTGHDPVQNLPDYDWKHAQYPSAEFISDSRNIHIPTHMTEVYALEQDIEVRSSYLVGGAASKEIESEIRDKSLFVNDLDQFRSMMAHLVHGSLVVFLDIDLSSDESVASIQRGIVCATPNRFTRTVSVRYQDDFETIVEVPFICLMDWFTPDLLSEERIRFFEQEWNGTQKWAKEQFKSLRNTYKDRLENANGRKERDDINQHLNYFAKAKDALKLQDDDNQPLCVQQDKRTEFNYMLTQLKKNAIVYFRLPLVSGLVRGQVVETFDETCIIQKGSTMNGDVAVRILYDSGVDIDLVNVSISNDLKDGKLMRILVSSIVDWEPGNDTYYHYRAILAQMTVLIVWMQLMAMRAIWGKDRVVVR